jgi:eukaryotic-like serine/threonine-protein kinase
VTTDGLEAGDPLRVGRYSVLRRLGRGGMSTVFRAYDPELDRQIALKLLTSWDEADTEGPARLVREARAMAKITHPNVAAVYDVGLVDDGVFIAMELIEGPTLETWTRATARPWTEVLRMYLLAGRGLAAAHDAGLVHRDFKPDNVMVGLDERPRVLDFGLARPAASDDEDELLLPDESSIPMSSGPPAPWVDAASSGLDRTLGASLGPQSASVSGSFDLQISITRTGIVTGTPAYMAPEQHLGEAGGPASDQFAFCVSLWEALYRQRPFAGDNFFEVADAIVEGRLVAPPGHVRVPGWITNLLERGLASEPEHRHPSMRSLLASFVFSFKVMHGMA